jgi:YD repeat-containing protein
VQRSTGGTPQTTSATYSATGKTLTATDPNGHVTTFAYDLLDRVSTVTDPMSRVTSTGYDALSRRTQVTNTAIQSTPLQQWSYTANGRLASLTDGLGNATGYAYDGFDRLATTTYPNSSTEELTYDADSNVATRVTRNGDTISYDYDTLNRLSSKVVPGSPAMTVSYGYDLAGRLTSVGQDTTSNPAIADVAVPGAGAGVNYTTYAYYDRMNRLVGKVWDGINTPTGPPSTSSTFDHWYNDDDQRVYQTADDNGWWSYPAASASTVSYTANDMNQYTAVDSVTPTYDANGNLTYDGTFTYTYDAENRLVAASGAGNTVSYAYDGLGRRKSKTVNGTTTLYVSDGDREVLEYDGATGAVLRRYTYGARTDEALDLISAAGDRTILVPDIQGSIIGRSTARARSPRRASGPMARVPTRPAPSDTPAGASMPRPPASTTTTAPASTPPPSAASSSQTPLDTKAASTSTHMSETIR